MNDRTTSGDELDARIDAFLRRRFAPPPGIDLVASRCRKKRSVPRSGRWLAVLAVAALVLVVLRLALLDGTSEKAPAERAPIVREDRPATVELTAEFCSLVGPLQEPAAEPGRVHEPDLARLYQQMDACQRSGMPAACGESDNLAERLSLTYDQDVALRPDAAGHLYGPFGSEEWPTATIVTATRGERTAVLVADLDATLVCCVRPRLEEEWGLRLFTRALGSITLTEITPLEEPTMLPYFE